MGDCSKNQYDTGQNELIKHPFLQTQLVYDHAQTFVPPYTLALWERQHARILDDIMRFKPLNKIRLLDVGCGQADFSEILNDHIDLYFGLDPSFVELKRAKSRPGRFLAHGIGEHLDYLAKNSFDVVLLISVLDHTIDWKKTINCCSEVLRPGGLMLIVMENEAQLPNRFRKLFGQPVEHSGHMHYLRLNDISTLLCTRFAILKAKTLGYGFGLHKITTKIRIPQPIFKTLIPIIDSIGSLLSPNGGQVLYGLYQKNSNASIQASSHFLVCPSCKAPMDWGENLCKKCHFLIPYQNNILDALALIQKSDV